MNLEFISQIIGGRWCIDPQMMPLLADMAANSVTGKSGFNFLIDKSKEKNAMPAMLRPFVFSHRLVYVPGALQNGEPELPKDAVGVIPIRGLLLKRGYQGAPGMEDVISWVSLAENEPRISRVLFFVDSDGGSTDGAQALADAIRRMNKPSLAFVDGQMTGTAYLAGSAARRIIVCDDTAMLGGVGVVYSFANLRGMLEKQGVKFHDIAAKLSPHKNKEQLDAMKGEYEAMKTNQLDPLAEIFINYVGQHRTGARWSMDKWSAGKTFLAKEALSLGLIDEIGDVRTALKTLQNLSV